MKAHSKYIIEEKSMFNGTDKKPGMQLIVTDEDPHGVTIEIMNDCGVPQNNFNLPRIKMIEALEYILNKLKTTS